MLGKRYSLGSVFEPTGEPLVKVANFKELAQQSEDIKSFLATFKPDPGYMYLHVIAVGAGEYWGKNINSDYFLEDDLLNRYKTFETDAKVFREHDNKPYSQSYGYVPFAWYNMPMHRVELILAIDKIKGKEFVDRQNAGEQLCVSMGCFPAGTDVLLADNTFKHIEDINPGDKVITHTGEEHEVTTKMLHEHTGNMCRIKASGQTQELICTDNHPILVRRYTGLLEDSYGECPVCNKKFNQVLTHIIRSTNKEHIVYRNNMLDHKYLYKQYWTDAKNILPGDFILTPITKATSDHVKNIDLAKIIGYFLAEGSFVKNKKKEYRAIQFNFHKNEINLHQDVLGALTNLSQKIASYQIREEKHLGVISLYDEHLATTIKRFCGEYSKYKVLNPDVYTWTLEEKLYIIGKYFDGDGTFNKKHKSLSATTISKNLAYSIASLANTCGISTRISSYNGKHNIEYTIDIDKEDTKKLKCFCSKIPENYSYTRKYKTIKKSFVDDGFLCKRVYSIETYYVNNLPVYNLSVEGDESYTANSIAVHNCRVKFDVCSLCGNHASKPHEYCEHIKYHKGEIFPDGKQAYMINPNPTFFDISIVRRPAWKPAFCLAKVASTDTDVNTMSIQEKNALAFEELDSLIPMEKTAEVWEIPEDDELLGAKVLAKHSSVQKVALDKQMPAISVQDIDAEIRDMLPAINKLEPDLPAPLLDDLARKYEIKDILHSFASAAIPMKPQEFTRIVIVKNNLPLEAFGTVMTGILGSFHGNGKSGSGNTEVATPNILPGISRPEIMEKLAPFIHARSAILKDVLSRLNRIFDTKELQKLGLNKTAAVLYQPNPVLDSLDLSPRMNFGYVRRVPEFQDSNRGLSKDTVLVQDPMNLSTMPVALSRESLVQEIRNPSISDYSRNQLLALGALQGKDFSAFKDPRIINSVIHEPGFLSYLALLINSFKSKGTKAASPLDTKSILSNVSLEHLTNAYNPVPRIISQEYYTRY